MVLEDRDFFFKLFVRLVVAQPAHIDQQLVLVLVLY